MLIGFSARNHPQQDPDPDVDDRGTPRDLFESLDAAFQFSVDAAASYSNNMLPYFWTKEENGLERSWKDHRVWCNPPYSSIEPWIIKAWNEMRAGSAECVVMLLPANRTEQRWWQHHVEPRRDCGADQSGVSLSARFLPGRLRFVKPASWVVPKKGDRPPFGCVLLTWRREP